jgi:hypothetical protein
MVTHGDATNSLSLCVAMARPSTILAGLGTAWACQFLALAQAPAPQTPLPHPAVVQPAAPWALDELRLANGSTLRGLILDESTAIIRFQMIRQTPGKPTVTLTSLVYRADIAKMTKLPDAERCVRKWPHSTRVARGSVATWTR